MMTPTGPIITLASAALQITQQKHPPLTGINTPPSVPGHVATDDESTVKREITGGTSVILSSPKHHFNIRINTSSLGHR